MGSIDVRQCSGALGAEVRGVELAALDDATWKELHDLWLEHLVLFFPDQHLDPDAHVAFARRLGEPEIHPFIPKLDDDHPEIVVLDSVKADEFHTDVTFSPTPPIASVLQMVEMPASGGDTIWTNQYLAFETLSPPIRELVSGLTAVHTAWPMGHPEMAATHPAVRVHPETGRRSLFVNRGFTSHFVELRRSESEALLGYLWAWSEQPGFQCRYRWSDGAVALWDNRCTQHYGVPDFDGRRVLQRVTVLGDAPVGEPPRWEPSPYAARRGEAPTAADPRTNSITDES